MLVRLARNLATLLLIGTPVVLSAQKHEAAKTPTEAVDLFMTALRDSNLVRVAELWGTEKGPASRTHQPTGYEKKIIIMQLMLKGVKATTLNDVPGVKGFRAITTRLNGRQCRVTLTVNVVHASEGWLVHDFDLDQAAQVNRPCPSGGGGN